MNLGALIRPLARTFGMAPGLVQIGLLTIAYIGWLLFAPRYGVIDDLGWIGLAVAVVAVSRLMNKDWFVPPQGPPPAQE